MKKIILLVLTISIILAAFQYRITVSNIADKLIYYSPCDTPITYTIGGVDPRFNITESEFLSDTKQAADIWNSAEQKQLLAYSPESKFTISLVYDQRQGLNNQISDLNSQLQVQDNALKPEIADYENNVAQFQKDLDAFNQQANYWNARGGAPPDEYQKLKAEQASLQARANELNQMAVQLKQSTNNYNANVNELNQKIDIYNQALQGKPEEGLYIQDENGKRIIIYFDVTSQELVHTLAHEMGHALGVEHVNNQDDIMYPYTNNSITISESDISQLQTLCQKRSIINYYKDMFSLILYRIKNGKPFSYSTN